MSNWRSCMLDCEYMSLNSPGSPGQHLVEVLVDLAGIDTRQDLGVGHRGFLGLLPGLRHLLRSATRATPGSRKVPERQRIPTTTAPTSTRRRLPRVVASGSGSASALCASDSASAVFGVGVRVVVRFRLPASSAGSVISSAVCSIPIASSTVSVFSSSVFLSVVTVTVISFG